MAQRGSPGRKWWRGMQHISWGLYSTVSTHLDIKRASVDKKVKTKCEPDCDRHRKWCEYEEVKT